MAGAPQTTNSERLTELFGSKIETTERYFGIGACWESEQIGRPKVRINGKTVGAARWVASLVDGLVLKDKAQFACHHCDNLRCFRPDHIYTGNALTNNQDTAARARNSLVNRRLSFEEAEEIRNLSDTGKSQRFIARQYGLTKTAISQIINRKTYVNAS